MYQGAFTNEEESLQLISQGDKEAYRQLFNLLWDFVYSTALRLTKSPEMAQDLSQEVFMKLWENRSKLPEVRNIHTFLYTITRNLALDYLRASVFKESRKDLLRDYFRDADATPLDLLENKELGKELEHAVDSLSPQLRQVFRLNYLEAMDHRQIAREMGITTVSSRVYLVRARAQLKKHLSRISEKLSIGAFLLILFFSNFCPIGLLTFVLFIRPLSGIPKTPGVCKEIRHFLL